MTQLIVFDLDGTLVDSRRDLADAANELIRALGGTPQSQEAIVRMVGEGAAVLVRRALGAAGLDPEEPGALDRFLAIYDGCLLDHTVPYDGTMEVLSHLEGKYRLGVLTNKPSGATARLLAGLGLDRFFEVVVGGDTPFGRKPNPAGLCHIVAATGATASSTLLVGDSPVDLATARAARTGICLARFGFGYSFAKSDFDGTEQFIDSPAELLRVLNHSGAGVRPGSDPA
jgi:phosphoglycolate phosphatase